MTINAESPTPTEIKEQLVRMRGNYRVQNAPNQSDFLALVVERALEGKKTPGHVIAKILFPEKFNDKEFGDVRATANKLRLTLARYYAQEGGGDLVVIALREPPKDKKIKLPEGEAYTPQFSYNPAHPVGKEYELGMYHLTRGMWEDYSKARDHFASVLKMSPEHIGASIGIAEAWIGTLLWDKQTRSAEDIEKSVQKAAETLQCLDKRASGFWRLHALGGFMLMGQGNIEKAKVAFDTALKLDRASTETYPFYFSYLIKIGNRAEAIRLVQRHVETHPDDMAAYIECAKVLIRAEQFPEAMAVLRKALELDKGYYAVHLFLAVVYVAIRQPELAFDHIMKLKLLADDTTFRLFFSTCCKGVEAWPQDKKNEWDKLAKFFNLIFPSREPSPLA